MSDEALDLSGYRARREEAIRQDSRKRDLEQIDSKRALDELLARCQALASMEPDDRAAEAERREQRRSRLRDAGVGSPRGEAPMAAAWQRVVEASNANEAAKPGHPGSLFAMRAIDRWGEPRVRLITLALSGERGTGKTVASWYAVAAHGGLYVREGDVAPTPRWDDLRERAKRTGGLLVVNDVTERLSGWAWGAVAELVESRHDIGLRSMITTNLDEGTLLAKLGSRMASRFGDEKTGQGAILTIDGPDMRGQS